MPTIELHQVFPNGTIHKTGSTIVTLEPGEKIDFRKTGQGGVEKIFEGEAPAGKIWQITISVSTVETDE